MSSAKKKRDKISSSAGGDGNEVTARKRGRKMFVSKRPNSRNENDDAKEDALLCTVRFQDAIEPC